MSPMQQLVQNNLIFFFSILTTFIIGLFVWNIILSQIIQKLRKKNEVFFSGGKTNNLEELLLSQANTLKLLDKDIQELFNISNQINGLALRGIHKVGIVRFNPFSDVGGDQSFALALLNGKNNGITVSSLYTREGTRIYAKSIVNGESEKHPLTNEEKEAIKVALEPKELKKTKE